MQDNTVLLRLRESMKRENVTYYIVPTSDYHQSEYVSEFFKTLEYVFGFTGSAGTIVISKEDAGLWTDGRYFIQAERELVGSGITLFRMQEEGVPSVIEYIAARAESGDTIAFDGRIVAMEFAEQLSSQIEKGVIINYHMDLVGELWKERPELLPHDVFRLKEDMAGRSTAEKLDELRNDIRKKQGTAMLLAKPEDIMWLFNIRGSDVEYNPIAFSYAIIFENMAELYLYEEAVNEDLRNELSGENISLLPYEKIYEHKGTGKLLLDRGAVSIALYDKMREYYVIDFVKNHEMIQKAIKNQTEISECQKAHILDGIAVTRLIYYLKKMLYLERSTVTELTECDVVEMIESFRCEYPEYLYPSFATIAAYNENAAMMHYKPVENQCAKIAAEGMLLVDTGGQYYGATTDITRTIVLGDITREQKEHYTAVVKGMLNLLNANFLYGCTGRNLDILARMPIWKLGIDYRCGTGHGVGSFLCVHEGPQAFRWRASDSLPEVVLEPGMVITDEPGIYIEGKYGIRIENELLCVEREKTEWGRFLGFEVLTYAPIDLDAIIPEQMTKEEKEWLNVYHRKVFEMLCPHLEDDEKKWLSKYAHEI